MNEGEMWGATLLQNAARASVVWSIWAFFAWVMHHHELMRTRTVYYEGEWKAGAVYPEGEWKAGEALGPFNSRSHRW